MPESRRLAQLQETVNLLLGAGGEVAYNSLKARRDEITETLRPTGRGNEFVLRAWLQAAPDDWEIWIEAVDASDAPSHDEATAASALVPWLFESWTAVSGSQVEEFADLVEVVVGRLQPATDDEAVHPVVEVLENTLESPDWAADADARERREHLHAAARELRGLGSTTWQRVEALLTNDLVAALEQPRGPSTGTSALEAVRGAETMGQYLGDGPVARVIRRIPEFDPGVEADEACAEVSARGLLTGVARDRGLEWKKPPFGVSHKRVRAVVETGGEDLDDAVSHWLLLGPKASEVAPVALALLPELPNGVKEALNRWSASSTRPQRTTLAQHLLRGDEDASAWLRVLAKEPLNEAGLAEILRDRVLNGASVEIRTIAAREARALDLETRGAGQALGGAVSVLLRKSGRAKGDIGVAALLAAALPRASVKQDTWSKALRKRCDERNYRLSEEEVQALRAAGVEIPKDGIAKRLRKALFG